MKVTLITVGRIRDQWIRDGLDEYSKRLKRFCRLEILEIPDRKVPESFSEKEITLAVNAEGERILQKWPADCWSIALTPGGKQLGSEGLARLLDARMVSGTSHFLFLVGGSNGLSDQVLKKADSRLSFGSHTFPHQLFRVMLLEQIYRAQKIRSGETYHK